MSQPSPFSICGLGIAVNKAIADGTKPLRLYIKAGLSVIMRNRSRHPARHLSCVLLLECLDIFLHRALVKRIPQPQYQRKECKADCGDECGDAEDAV